MLKTVDKAVAIIYNHTVKQKNFTHYLSGGLRMKDYEFVDLYDTYGALLTEHQRTLVEGYYLYDLSFQELAETNGGSRQSVYDAVKKARKTLSDYEAKLSLVEIKKQVQAVADEIEDKTISKRLTDAITKNGL